jgi:phage head maturation protease
MEKRYFNSEVRLGEGEESRHITAYGIVFNSESRVMDSWSGKRFVEIIRPEAVDGLLENEDIRAYYNHNRDMILARNKISMSLIKDEVGVRYEFD